jgi:hypothetical protein
MKHSAPQLIKFRTLKRRLGNLPEYQVVGILEMIWHIGMTDAHDGGIGKFTNEEIAARLEWAGDPDNLIGHLVATHWLDADPVYRLMIHDWADHCPQFVKGALARHGKKLGRKSGSSKEPPKGTSYEEHPQPNSGTSYKEPALVTSHHNITQHNITQHNLLVANLDHQTSTPKPKFSPESLDLPFASEAFRAAWLDWCRHRREIRHALTPKATTRQLAMLASMGEQPAIDSIHASILAGYQGLFKPKGGDAVSRPVNGAPRLDLANIDTEPDWEKIINSSPFLKRLENLGETA